MVRNPSPQGDESFFALNDHPNPKPPHLVLRDSFRKAGASAASGSIAPAAGGRLAANRSVRLAALGLLGGAIGIGGAVLGVSFVQASDRIDMYEVVRIDENQRRARRAGTPQVLPASHSSYAPARPTAFNPLSALDARGMVQFPDFNVNPFQPTTDAKARRKAKTARAGTAGTDTVSGSANEARSICVRLCDGYQHPLALLRDSADLKGHEALCKAMFPGVPTRVFRVAAGANGIDEAVGPDGKTYRDLPMAYAYQSSIDPACARPRTGAQTISVLRDFTLRPGDAVVIDGRPKVFSGSSTFPYKASNFRDFRASSAVSNTTRRQMDEIVGVSRQERLQREVRRMARVREANLRDGSTMIDIVRGGPTTGAPVRVIDLGSR